jgi:nitroimidazol reductase NimA-like FMN-containing flavoprotein (pyridoxamine 5'-phosphate oxidase superfamily)
MPRPMTVHEREEFLAGLHVAVLSVARDDGRPPLTVPVFYGYQSGGDISFFTGSHARKTPFIRKAGVLSLTVQREEPPYKYVTVEGTVVRTDQPPSADQILPVVRRYMSEEQAQGFVTSVLEAPDIEYVLFTVRPDRWLTGDFTDDG